MSQHPTTHSSLNLKTWTASLDELLLRSDMTNDTSCEIAETIMGVTCEENQDDALADKKLEGADHREVDKHEDKINDSVIIFNYTSHKVPVRVQLETI